MAPPDTDDGRVTLAVLKNELGHLAREIAQLRQEIKDWQVDERTWRNECTARVGLVEADVDDLRQRATRTEERLRTTTGALAALQFISATIAAAFGAWFK